jgi:hypothetical protein
MFLLDDILLAPVHGVIWLGKQMTKEANKQLFDEASIKEALGRLQELYERGEVSEKEFQDLEERLLLRLQKAMELKRQKTG